MEQEVVLKEILNALSDHSKQLNQKMDKINKQIDERFDKVYREMDKRFDEVNYKFNEVNYKIDNLNKKVDGLGVILQETQETAEFAASKVIQHEKKLRQLNSN